MYQASIASTGSLETLPSAAFDFGTGDFTVMAMVQSTQGGTAVARKGTAGGAGNGGFLLVVNPDGSVKFATDNGFGYFQALTGPTTVLDGDCHTVAGIRTGAALKVLIDGLEVPVTTSGNGASPLDVDNGLPLTIGRTDQEQEPHNQFVGGIMNVSVWRAALSGDRIVKAAFARVGGDEPDLAGYWTLDGTTEDLSANANAARITGPVTFAYCLDCVWAEASNDYSFCQITNMPDSRAPAMNVTLSRELQVPGGAPALAFAIMADQDEPAFPAGVTVTLTDPAGTVYDQDVNSDTLYARTVDGQLWGLMASPPAAGPTRVSVTAPAATPFHLNFQTVPSTDVVATSEQALEPLFGNVQPQLAARSARSLGGFWDVVKIVAVAAVVGVIAVAAVVILAPATPAIIAVTTGLAAFTATAAGLAQAALTPIAQTHSLHESTGQVIGMAGFVVAADKLLLMDANVVADPATQIGYKQRKNNLYPAVTASTFNAVQSRLIERQMKREQVKSALSSFASGYVSACGHGRPSYLMGWYVSGDDGPLEEVLNASGKKKFTPAEAQGKIIHFFACHCGYDGSAEFPGLGEALVAGGAVSFFGYDEAYVLSSKYPKQFCAGDIEIDLQMIRGRTCAEAYTQAIAIYNANINRLRVDGHQDAAATLEANRDKLVSPTTNAIYGNPDARLQIGS